MSHPGLGQVDVHRADIPKYEKPGEGSQTCLNWNL
jgi:hypothetical protein